MSLTSWIIYNGSLPSPKFLDFAQMLQHAAEQKGHEAILYKNNELLSYLQTNKLGFIEKEKLNLPDYVIFTDKDIYLAKQLQYLGVRVFNRAETIAMSDDKILTYQQLAKHSINIPQTIIAPKVFTNEPSIQSDYLLQISEQLTFPLIIKEAFGSFGEQVYLIETFDELISKVNELKGTPFIFQQFIKSSFGKDLRLQVVGNKVVAAMKRTSVDDFRANVTTGGSMEKYEPTDIEKKISIKAAKALQADFAGIDLLFGENGEPIVCEVNSNAHIRNLLTCTGINSAPHIINYIETELEEM